MAQVPELSDLAVNLISGYGRRRRQPGRQDLDPRAKRQLECVSAQRLLTDLGPFPTQSSQCPVKRIRHRSV